MAPLAQYLVKIRGTTFMLRALCWLACCICVDMGAVKAEVSEVEVKNIVGNGIDGDETVNLGTLVLKGFVKELCADEVIESGVGIEGQFRC